MKLTYTIKISFNINGTLTIHSTFTIFLNKNFNELKALSDEKCDCLVGLGLIAACSRHFTT
jgi:hypothetical protein